MSEYVYRLQTVSTRMVACEEGHREAKWNARKECWQRPVRRRITVPVPPPSVVLSTCLAQVEANGGEAEAMGAYIGGAIIAAGQDAQSDVAGGGKITDKRVNEYIVAHIDEIALIPAAQRVAVATKRLEDATSDATSDATEKEEEELTKLANAYKKARVSEARARAAARVGTTG